MNPKSRERYPEKRLQVEAIAWVTENWGYSEKFSDQESVGADFDSVGLLGNRIALIEVKVSVTARMSWHDERLSTIERKIASGLAALYSGGADSCSRSANAIWDRRSHPIIGVLASSYSDDGLGHLRDMLDLRSSEWMFEFRIWRWTGQAVVELARGYPAKEDNPAVYDEIVIPRLFSRPIRARARSFEELKELAEQRGVGDLFAALLDEARAANLRMNRLRGGVTVARKNPVDGMWQTTLSILLESSSAETGLNVGIALEYLGLEEVSLPGIEASPAGFMNTNRYLATGAEVSETIALLQSAPVPGPASR